MADQSTGSEYVQGQSEGSNNKKMTTCKHCGAVIAKGAKVCPNCGGKNKKPIYKRVWFIALVIVVVLGIIGSIGGGEDAAVDTQNQEDAVATADTSEEPIEYLEADVGTMIDALESNALQASETYKDQYVQITGMLNVIDASGEYISVVDANDDFAITDVMCYIKNDEQLAAVKNMSVGQMVTVKGKITDVGEVFGYYMDIEEIVPVS